MTWFLSQIASKILRTDIQAACKAKEIELAAKQEQLKLKERFERENESARKKLDEHESRLAKREDTLDRKLDTLSVKERNLDDLEKRLATRQTLVADKEQQVEGTLARQGDDVPGKPPRLLPQRRPCHRGDVGRRALAHPYHSLGATFVFRGQSRSCVKISSASYRR